MFWNKIVLGTSNDDEEVAGAVWNYPGARKYFQLSLDGGTTWYRGDQDLSASFWETYNMVNYSDSLLTSGIIPTGLNLKFRRTLNSSGTIVDDGGAGYYMKQIIYNKNCTPTGGTQLNITYDSVNDGNAANYSTGNKSGSLIFDNFTGTFKGASTKNMIIYFVVNAANGLLLTIECIPLEVNGITITPSAIKDNNEIDSIRVKIDDTLSNLVTKCTVTWPDYSSIAQQVYFKYRISYENCTIINAPAEDSQTDPYNWSNAQIGSINTGGKIILEAYYIDTREYTEYNYDNQVLYLSSGRVSYSEPNSAYWDGLDSVSAGYYYNFDIVEGTDATYVTIEGHHGYYQYYENAGDYHSVAHRQQRYIYDDGVETSWDYEWNY